MTVKAPCQAGPDGHEPSHAVRQVIGAKGKRSHDNGIRTGRAQPWDRVFADAAIGGKKRSDTCFIDHAAGLAKPVFGLRVEPDTLDAHFRAKKRQHRQPIKMRLYGWHGCM